MTNFCHWQLRQARVERKQLPSIAFTICHWMRYRIAYQTETLVRCYNYERHLQSETVQTSISSKDPVNNRPFAQLMPRLETGHPVTVGQSPAHESHTEQSKTETRKTVFCSSETLKSYAGDWPTVTGCPVSNPGNNCANDLFPTVTTQEPNHHSWRPHPLIISVRI